MLALPVDEKQPDGEGSSIERPVPIHDVSFDDFEVIVRDAYNRCTLFAFNNLFVIVTELSSDSRLSISNPTLKTWPVWLVLRTDYRQRGSSCLPRPKL